MVEFTADQLIDRAFLRAAHVMHSMWEETGDSDTRLLDNLLIPDKYVVVGESILGNECREHVIPRRVLCFECYRMFDKGADIAEVAAFLRRNLKIVRISREERDMLDHASKLNLKQCMPNGWNFSDGDHFARLKLAKIELIEVSPQDSSTPEPLRESD